MYTRTLINIWKQGVAVYFLFFIVSLFCKSGIGRLSTKFPSLAHFYFVHNYPENDFTIFCKLYEATTIFSSSTRMHPAGGLGHGHPLPGQVRHGQDGSLRPRYPAAAGASGRTGNTIYLPTFILLFLKNSSKFLLRLIFSDLFSGLCNQFYLILVLFINNNLTENIPFSYM